MRTGLPTAQSSRQFYQDWVIVLVILLVAGALRFWQLGDAPLGLYRDEAFNGLDALRVLAGDRPLFFPANNGREPLFIYSVAASIAGFGRTPFAIRLPAAVFGTLTVIPLYFFAKQLFDRQTAIFAALLWAITLWPIHLSRVGFRSVLLPFFMTLAAWALVRAVRAALQQPDKSAWGATALAGAMYGLCFYTYLASRLSVGILAILFILAWLRFEASAARLRLVKLALVYAFAAALVTLPLVLGLWQAGELTGGRTSDVSVLSPSVNGGNVLGTLVGNFGRTLGMFLFQGDTILRHNPAGRPVFDWLMALPCLFGVAWSLRHWRRASSIVCLSWTLVMLLGTVLAEDAPHFLRAAGVLPVILIFPAIGLSHLWNWSKLPTALGRVLSGALVVSSCWLSFHDYFVEYVQQPDTGYMFEAAAQSLAEQANEAAADGQNVMIDAQFLAQWQAVPFLLDPSSTITSFTRDALLKSDKLEQVNAPLTLFVWPYEPHDFVSSYVGDGAKVATESGPLMRLDHETVAYPLFTRYSMTPDWQLELESGFPLQTANFDNVLKLYGSAEFTDPHALAVRLIWQTQEDAFINLSPSTRAFVHVVDQTDGRLIGQLDGKVGGDLWQTNWWRTEIFVEERRNVALEVPFDAMQHAVFVGLYDITTNTRWPLADSTNDGLADSVQLVVNGSKR